MPLAIRLPPDLEAWLRAEAAREDRSVTGFIEALLERERGRREVQTKRGKK